MSVHTYIGARYVPRFMGTYDPTQQYEALDVVDNGSGTSYIARDIVPAGTPLTDTTHWFVYGASSGAIIALQNDMIQAQNDILALQGEDVNINDYIHDYSFKKRKVVTLSDSYGMTISPSWTDYFDTYSGVATGNHHTLSVSGCAFAYRGGSYQTFEDLATTVYNSLGAADAAEITDIIVAAGYNDAQYIRDGGTANDVYLAIGSFVTYCKTNFPNARIYIGFIGWQVKPGAVATSILEAAFNEYQKCSAWGVEYLNGVEETLYDNRLLNANHPNAQGMIALGRSIAQAWKSGTFEQGAIEELITNYNLNANMTNVTQNVNSLAERITGKTFELVTHDTSDALEIRATCPDMSKGVSYPVFLNNAPINKSTWLKGTAIIALVSNGVAYYEPCQWTYVNGLFSIIPLETHTVVTLIRVLGFTESISIYD